MIYELTLIITGGIIFLIFGFVLVIYLLFKYGLVELPMIRFYDASTTGQCMSSTSDIFKISRHDLPIIDKSLDAQHSFGHENDILHFGTCLAGWVRIKTTYLMEDGFEDFPDYCLVHSQNSTSKNKKTSDRKSSKHQKSPLAHSTDNLNYDASENKDRNYYKYLFLKNKHLFIYSSDKREHCDGVVSLTSDCTVTLIPDTLLIEELFCKQYPIRITNHSGPIIGSSHTCYIYAVNCSEKEDWYRALLGACKEDNGEPHKYHITTFERHVKDIQSPLLDQNTQWFNALLTRMVINACMSPQFEGVILTKLNRKTSRLRKPFFVGDVTVKEVVLGDTVPLFGRCQLHSFEPSGEINVSADFLYTGGFQVVVTTTARLDLPKMKPIIIPLLLSILVRRICGRVLFRIKSPPTDRIWIGFYGLPSMDLKIDPIVSTKNISLAMVHSIIQRRIEDILFEYMVLPNMDDWVIPSSEHEKDAEEQISRSSSVDYASSYSSINQSLSRRRTFTKATEMEDKNVLSDMNVPQLPICSTSLPSLPLGSKED